MSPLNKTPRRMIIVAGGAIAVMLVAGLARAENEGQEDLDRATETKLTASKSADLNKVISLCDSAIEKGLSEGNKRFAEQLLASTLIQRGMIRAKLIGNAAATGGQWVKTAKAALEDLERAVKLSPDQPAALLQIARLNLLPGGNTARAKEALDRVIELAVDDPQQRSKALLLRAGFENDPQKRLDMLNEAIELGVATPGAFLARALVHADMEQLDKGLTDLDKAIEINPRHAATYELKSLILAKMKKYDEAMATLEKLQKLRPDSIHPRMQKARLFAQQEKFEEALKELDKAHAAAPEDVAVLLLRAGVRQQLDQFDEAVADVDAALKVRPDLQPAMRIRAVLLTVTGEMDKAVEQLEELRKLAPKDLFVMIQLASVHHATKDYRKAADTFSDALAQHPDSWLALRGRADSRLALGEHKLALADYGKAIELRPEDAALLNNLAWVLATSPRDELRDGARAVELAAKACRLTEYKEAYILSTLAAAHAELGDFEEAKKWINKAIEVGGPDQPEAIKKELQSYREKKPWRELLTEETAEEGEPDEETEQ
jgi:tetratricopeptide (TPR) repeat protein